HTSPSEVLPGASMMSALIGNARSWDYDMRWYTSAAVPPNTRSCSVTDNFEQKRRTTSCHFAYGLASRQTGQSEPNITRCGPKASTTVLRYVSNWSPVQHVQSASVTRPETLQCTFSRSASLRIFVRHRSTR